MTEIKAFENENLTSILYSQSFKKNRLLKCINECKTVSTKTSDIIGLKTPSGARFLRNFFNYNEIGL